MFFNNLILILKLFILKIFIIKGKFTIPELIAKFHSFKPPMSKLEIILREKAVKAMEN